MWGDSSGSAQAALGATGAAISLERLGSGPRRGEKAVTLPPTPTDHRPPEEGDDGSPDSSDSGRPAGRVPGAPGRHRP